MFRLLAQEVPCAELPEVRRFDAAWEADASVRLRAGDFTAYAAYDRHGRMRGADQDPAMDRGGPVARRPPARQERPAAGRVQQRGGRAVPPGPGHADPARHRPAAPGRAVGRQPRRYRRPDPGPAQHQDQRGRPGADQPRHTTDHRLARPHAQVSRRELDGTWTSPFLVPRAYLADYAELDYAGNTHVGQGRTVDTADLLVTGTLSRRSLYVGLTRGRESNTAHIVTGNTAPPGDPPHQQASPESVIKAIMDRDDADLSATEQIRHAQDRTGGTGHLLTLWSAAVLRSLHPQIDEQIKARLTESQAWRYDREHSRPALQQRLRVAPLAGHDIGELIDQITAAPLDGARSISSVLHGRLQQLELPDLGYNVNWARRTPANAPAVAHELAAGLDDRARALGERLAVTPEPWLAKQLGVLAPHASPVLREEYARRAAVAAAYREAAGITDPGQAIAPEPHRGNPELDHMRQAAIRALEIRDETEVMRGMTQGELETRILDADPALASAPPDVSRELRLTAQAEADAWQQSADADIRRDQTGSADAKALARYLVAHREQLEAANARYEKWAADTSSRREAAGKARAELQRRGLAQQTAGQRHPEPEDEPQAMVEWWRQLEADLAAVHRAIEREHQAAIAAGEPWPPERNPQLEAEPVSEPESSPGAGQEADGRSGPDDQAAWLDRLRGQATEAARRFTAEKAAREARAEYAARLDRDACAEPEHTVQAQASYEADMEL
jgi:hypothetical protein